MTKITPTSVSNNLVAAILLHATPRDEVRHWHSSYKSYHAAVIKLLIRFLSAKLSHSPFRHSILIFVGNYLPI